MIPKPTFQRFTDIKSRVDTSIVALWDSGTLAKFYNRYVLVANSCSDGEDEDFSEGKQIPLTKLHGLFIPTAIVGLILWMVNLVIGHTCDGFDSVTGLHYTEERLFIDASHQAESGHTIFSIGGSGQPTFSSLPLDKQIEEFWNDMDYDGNGLIARDEFKRFFRESAVKIGLREKWGDEVLDSVFDKFDIDGKGINRDEYKTRVEATLERNPNISTVFQLITAVRNTVQTPGEISPPSTPSKEVIVLDEEPAKM